MIKEAKSDDDIMRCFPVLSQLRKHLLKEDFTALIQDMFREGYRLAWLEKRGEVVCVAGFRITTTLFMGKNLYVDDLVTHEAHRSKGYGAELLEWLRTLALDNSCKFFHLDSGTQRDRAHKFYFSQGMTISTFHFSEALKKE